MTFEVIMAIALYQLIDLLANVSLACLPFRDYLRYSKKVTLFLLGILHITLATFRIVANSYEGLAAFLSFLAIILYLGFYMISIRTRFTKLLFVMLIILNYGSFVAIIYGYLLHFLTERLPYSLQANAVLVLIFAFSYPVMFLLMEKKVKPLIAFPENNKVWAYLWMVPATSFISYYFSIFANGGVPAFAASFSNTLFAVALIAGNLFIIFIVTSLVAESNMTMQLKADNYQLNLQFMQYENLKNRIEEARQARHDLRQNMMVIQSLVQNEDRARLLSYVNKYMKILPSDQPIAYCDHYALNAVIVYYAQLAQKQEIRFEVTANYDADTGIEDTDAVILLGNMLENAVEAASRMEVGEGYMILSISRIKSAVVIALDNSHNGTVRKSGEHFFSSKSNRMGMGIPSVQRIAEKYQGITKFEYDERVFHSSVLLNPEHNKL